MDVTSVAKIPVSKKKASASVKLKNARQLLCSNESADPILGIARAPRLAKARTAIIVLFIGSLFPVRRNR